jgi:hypothetical protein
MGERIVDQGFAHLTSAQVESSPYLVREMDPHLDWRGDEGISPSDALNHAEHALDFDKKRLSYDIVVDAEKEAHHAQLIRDADRRSSERNDEAFSLSDTSRGHQRSWLSYPLSLIRY